MSTTGSRTARTAGSRATGSRTTGLLAAGATFLAMLDSTVANLAVPSLAGDFPGDTPAGTLSGISWVITLYAIVFAALLAPAGRFSDVIGRRALFCSGVAVFTVMSLLCALAPNLDVLVVGRGLQAIGAAAMVPASLAVVLTDTPSSQRTKTIGLWSAAGALAAAIGPGLGGVLVEWVGWRSLFLINVPIGIVLFVAGLRRIGTGLRGGRVPDPIGTVILVLGVGLTVLGATKGEEWGWSSPSTLLALGLGPVLVALVLLRSTRHAVPVVETTLWRNRTFLRANLAAMVYGAALFTWLLVGVLVLTEQWHYSTLKAGLAMSPGALVASVTAIIASRVGERVGPRVISVVGSLTIFAVGVFCWVFLPENPHFTTFWLPLSFVIGFGIGLMSWSLSVAAVMSASPVKFASATGMNIACRQVGGALGIAAMTAVIAAEPGLSGYQLVYLVCGLCALAAAAASAGFHFPKYVPAPAPRSEATPATEGTVR
ncbi:DHA2 family efflux MFS transporter permease subunit [Kineosporia mesophila]|nr:DHA2 family efflux MFS transporter permease subunit [Kineosporia mesophila]